MPNEYLLLSSSGSVPDNSEIYEELNGLEQPLTGLLHAKGKKIGGNSLLTGTWTLIRPTWLIMRKGKWALRGLRWLPMVVASSLDMGSIVGEPANHHQ